MEVNKTRAGLKDSTTEESSSDTKSISLGRIKSVEITGLELTNKSGFPAQGAGRNPGATFTGYVKEIERRLRNEYTDRQGMVGSSAGCCSE